MDSRQKSIFAGKIFTAVLCIGLVSCFSSQTLAKPPATDIGKKALERTKTILSFGPRPPGSEALTKVQDQVIDWLKQHKLVIQADPFTANTPDGDIKMRNILGVHTGESSKIVMLACHLDSKKLPDITFLGANDAASACGLIIELIPIILKEVPHWTYWFVFFDGEEAIRSWSNRDSLYGSRNLAGEIAKAGLTQSVRAFVLLDMIGDRDLNVALETHADPELLTLFQESAKHLKVDHKFFQYRQTLQDDHLPFHRLGIPVIDLIDFRFGPANGLNSAGAYFHSAKDTIDKVSSESLDIVGNVVIEAFKRLKPLENDS